MHKYYQWSATGRGQSHVKLDLTPGKGMFYLLLNQIVSL